MTYIYIYVGLLMQFEAGEHDAIVHPPGSSVITIDDWNNMIIVAGTEATLIAQLGVVDLRGAA